MCRHSDKVLATVLVLAGRERILKAKTLIDARDKLREMLVLLEELA